jgi:histidine triad (HIT) family protein
VDYLFDMEDELLSDMMVFAKQVARKMKLVLPCRRIGVTVIGLEVPHAHFHLIPINGVSDMDFSKPKLQPSQSELAEVAQKIVEA